MGPRKEVTAKPATRKGSRSGSPAPISTPTEAAKFRDRLSRLYFGKSHLAQSIGGAAVKAGHVVLYRSIFDLVRELLEQDSQQSEARLLGKYLKPDLLIIDDMGLKVSWNWKRPCCSAPRFSPRSRRTSLSRTEPPSRARAQARLSAVPEC